MKNTFYFPHDYHARHDPKLEKLFVVLGYEGIGIYWNLIERLYEQGGYMNIADLDIVANGNVSLCERITKVIQDFNLFKIEDGKFWSESCVRRLHVMEEKSSKASQSAHKRWSKEPTAMPTHSDGYAIKKEINKEKKEIDREDEIRGIRFMEFWSLYPKPVGMGMAQMTFRATIKTDKDFEDLKTALKNYLASEEVKKGMIKNGSNWIEDWRGWLVIGQKKIAKPVIKIQPIIAPNPEERKKVADLIHQAAKNFGETHAI
jgi:uncharacterized protein YdaU (DUF1376 family)